MANTIAAKEPHCKPVLNLPHNLNTGALARFVRSKWQLTGADTAQLKFHPIGKDSWNFRIGEFFVSLRRDLRGHVQNTYVTLLDLVNSGQIAAVPPLPSRSGAVVEQFEGIPVLVFAYLNHRTLADLPSQARKCQVVLARLAALHNARTENDLPCEDFRISFRNSLMHILDLATGPVSDSGPYASQAQSAIAAYTPYIQAELNQIETLGAACRAESGPFVLTHGEPLPANFIQTIDGEVQIIDFTELAWGPPERDLFHVATSFGWDIDMRHQFRQFYALKWWLSEIEEYGRYLLAPHVGNSDDKEMLSSLDTMLPKKGHYR